MNVDNKRINAHKGYKGYQQPKRTFTYQRMCVVLLLTKPLLCFEWIS